MLMRNAGGAGAYWDYGWETAPLVDATRMMPHGLVYRLTSDAWDGAPVAEDERLWRDDFWPIATSPWVAPRGYDWTAQEVYARVFHVRAKVHADTGRWARAESEEKIAERLRPDFAETRAFLGLALMAQKKLAAAKAESDMSLQLDPLCSFCRSVAGQMRLLAGDRDGALAEYREAVRLEDNNVDYATRLIKLLIERQAWAEAARVAERAMPFSRDLTQWTSLQLYAARATIGLSRCDRARPHLRAVQKWNPFTPALNDLLAACGFKPGADL